MTLISKNSIDSTLSKETESAASANPSGSAVIDTQVKVKKTYSPRRSFDTAYKLRILSAYDNCDHASERGVLLRKEGLYHARICAWKKQLEHAQSKEKKQSKNRLRSDHLARENEQLKRKLSQAEAIIELQKKISDLLGTHILPTESSVLRS